MHIIIIKVPFWVFGLGVELEIFSEKDRLHLPPHPRL